MSAFPMILITVILYNLVYFGSGVAGQHDMQAILEHSFALKMFSGDVWNVTVSDLFVLLALAMLFVETVKAARSTSHADFLRRAGGVYRAEGLFHLGLLSDHRQRRASELAEGWERLPPLLPCQATGAGELLQPQQNISPARFCKYKSHVPVQKALPFWFSTQFPWDVPADNPVFSHSEKIGVQ